MKKLITVSITVDSTVEADPMQYASEVMLAAAEIATSIREGKKTGWGYLNLKVDGKKIDIGEWEFDIE